MNDLKKRILVIIAALSLTFMCFMSGGLKPSELQAVNTARIHYIDVGQGDSILIQVNSKNLLIDAGPEANADSLIAYLKKQKVKRLDYILATHPHEDHIGAMAAVINRFQVESFYAPKVVGDTRFFFSMAGALKNRNMKINVAKEGVALDLGDNAECILLSPCSESYSSMNDYSPVISLIYGNTSFLFMGDAEEYSENEILNHNSRLECDVLKIGHHGSTTSSSRPFLEAASPSIAIISVGKRNDFGHPGKAVLNLLKGMDIQIYRTDIDGTVIIESNGERIVKR
ncbi:MAG: ComEC/Rec2 family competence protein [Clostridiaceae bacterium]